MKKITFFIMVMVLGLSILTGCSSNAQPVMNQETSSQKEGTENQTSQTEKMQSQIDALETENAKLQKKVDEAAPWFALSELDKEKEVKRLKEEQEAKKAEEKKAAEESQKAAEEKEKKGYDTGITYSQLSRTPDKYSGEKVKFTGVVLQVLEIDNEVQLRIATKGKYDNIIYVVYAENIVSSRVLEDDKITVMGTSCGLYTYQSTGGGPISIPLIVVDKIEQ